jgi:RIO kinase 1
VTPDEQAFEEFDDYEARFDPLHTDRQARRRRRAVAHHVAKKDAAEVRAALADSAEGLEAGFKPTYQPSRYEEGWLLQSLQGFYEEELISDVEAVVKGGKEASVYRCAANPAREERWLAAKVYRPRQFRSLRNDAVYREGREVLGSGGAVVKKSDHRVMRAIGKKTAFGVQVAQTSWLMYDFTTMQRLYQAGAAVPTPVGAGENAILMEYLGDERLAAHTLSEIQLGAEEAETLLAEVIRNIELMLQQGVVHGDLSAYNILYWQGRIALIDFPQVTDYRNNQRAYGILARDIRRIAAYFGAQGAPCDAEALLARLWNRYAREAEAELRLRGQEALEQHLGCES